MAIGLYSGFIVMYNMETQTLLSVLGSCPAPVSTLNCYGQTLVAGDVDGHLASFTLAPPLEQAPAPGTPRPIGCKLVRLRRDFDAPVVRLRNMRSVPLLIAQVSCAHTVEAQMHAAPR
jgi:hypothetical protein